ncbi:hypothetical protein QAD02_006479 [Eretmocerus hayati]|uniref:Uncharacterized protein n=1 Tax=Eretmocerus hayati TaxID=131215 RepID=A0ACC2N137_9HYME|nr:hypothetical protein QAD02_006479 [Eretmocerus hayati]
MSLDVDYVRKYPYHCVEFKRAGRPSANNKMIDVIATKCFKIVKGSGKKDNRPKEFKVYFPPPPYSSETYKKYNKDLRELSCPLDSWQLYSVIIKARAGESFELFNIRTTAIYSFPPVPENLDEAIVKLKDLKEEQHAWSTSGANPEECEANAIESISRAQLLAQSQQILHTHEQYVNPTHVAGCDNSGIPEMMLGNNNIPQDVPGSNILSDSIDSRIQATPNSHTVGSEENGTPTGSQVFVTSNQSLEKSNTKRKKGSNKSSKNSTSDIKNNDDLMAAMLAEMKGLRIDIKDLNGNVDNSRRAITDGPGLVPKDFIGIVKELGQKFKYRIPPLTLKDFDRFDSELGNPKSSLKHHVMIVLQAGLDRKYIVSKSAINMLKMFIAKSVAVQYVTQKAVGGKDKERLMIKTNFYACIDFSRYLTLFRGLIRNHRMSNNGMTTGLKEVSSAVGTALTNAKTWPEDDSSESATCESTNTQSCISQVPGVTVAQVHTKTNHQAQPTVTRPILIEVPPKINLSEQPGTTRNDIDLIVSQEENDEPLSKQMRMDVDDNFSDKLAAGVSKTNADDMSNSEDSDEGENDGETSEFLNLIQSENDSS